MAGLVDTIRQNWDVYKANQGAFLALAVSCCAATFSATFFAVQWKYEADIRHLQVQVEELKGKLAAPNSPQWSEAEQKAVGQKVDEVLTEIAKTRSEGGPDKQQKLDVIEENFSVWAQKFQETRSTKLAALDRSKMSARVEEIQRAASVRALLASMLDVLARTADAYSKQTGHKIKYELPALPENPFTAKDGEWAGRVEFSPTLAWDIWTDHGRPPFGHEFFFRVQVDDKKHLKVDDSTDRFGVAAAPWSSNWHSFGAGKNYGAVSDLAVDSKPYTDHHSLEGAAKTLMETQLMLTFPQ